MTHEFRNESAGNDATEFDVTPWSVNGSVNYENLIEKFGTQRITADLLTKLASITGEIHPLLELDFFFSHRDFDWILDMYQK